MRLANRRYPTLVGPRVVIVDPDSTTPTIMTDSQRTSFGMEALGSSTNVVAVAPFHSPDRTGGAVYTTSISPGITEEVGPRSFFLGDLDVCAPVVSGTGCGIFFHKCPTALEAAPFIPPVPLCCSGFEYRIRKSLLY